MKSQADTVKQQLQELIALTNSDDHEPDVTTRLKFLAEQISLQFMSQPRYSSDTLLIAFRFLAISASVSVVYVLLCKMHEWTMAFTTAMSLVR